MTGAAWRMGILDSPKKIDRALCGRRGNSDRGKHSVPGESCSRVEAVVFDVSATGQKQQVI